MKRFGSFLVLAVIPIFLCAQTQDVDLIILLQRIDDAWNSPIEEGIKVWKEISADNSFIMISHNPQDETKTISLNRAEFLSAFELMQKNNPSTKHIHNTISLKVYGNIAYETANLEIHKKNGNILKSKVLNIYRKDEKGWKILFSTSADRIGELF